MRADVKWVSAISGHADLKGIAVIRPDFFHTDCCNCTKFTPDFSAFSAFCALSPRYPPLQAAFWAQTEENYCIDIPPDTGSVARIVSAYVVWSIGFNLMINGEWIPYENG